MKIKVRFIMSYEFETNQEPKNKDLKLEEEMLKRHIKQKIDNFGYLELDDDMILESLTVKKK